MELTASPICRFCGGGPLVFRFCFCPPEQNQTFKADFNLHSCQECGTFQVNPHLGSLEIKSFFSDPGRFEKGLDPEKCLVDPYQRAESRRREYLSYASAMIPFLPKGGVVLDVGAGLGLMLSLFPEKYEPWAVEPNPIAVDFLKKKGFNVFSVWAEDLSPPQQPLAALVMNQSLDHLLRADLFLAKALNWIAPGGLVLLGGLINPLSLAARIYGPKYRLWHPFHQIYPPFKAVELILNRYGFEILTIWKPYFKTSFGSPLRLARDALSLGLYALGRHPRSVWSPTWPGNTVTYLARKTVCFQPLKLPKQTIDSLNTPC